MPADLLLLFPGALGDFLCLWPTLEAFRRSASGRVAIVARPEVFPLLPRERLTTISIDRHEVADLFATGPLAAQTRALFRGFTAVHSWTGHGDANFARRLQNATGAVVRVHPFRGMSGGEHAADYYARCAGIEAVAAELEPARNAVRWTEDFFRAHQLGPHTLVLHPGSGSPKKNWQGMDTIAAWWRRARAGQVLVVRGPAEEEAGVTCAHDAELRGQPLDRVAAVLRRAHRYLGNDSGISHLAGAVGAVGVALFGPSEPRTWRPQGRTLRVLSAPTPCPGCAPNVFCAHRLTPARVRRALISFERRGTPRAHTPNSRSQEPTNKTPRRALPPPS